MNDHELSAYLDYMRAHIRAQDPQLVGRLNHVQLHDVFHTLPRPAVSFREWLERTGRQAGTTEAREEGPAVRGGDVEAANAKGLAALRALEAHGFPVTIGAER